MNMTCERELAQRSMATIKDSDLFFRHYALHARPGKPWDARSIQDFLVMIAEGPHPIPSRTR